MRIRLAVLALAALGAAAAFIGAAGATSSARATVVVRSSSFGSILFDGRGFALYAFTRDTLRHSNCFGTCASRWPPYIVRGSLKAGAGSKRSLLGTARRADGRRQVTYAGRPLYFYVGDRRARQVLCQDVVEFGGTWLVVRGSGRLVR
jgi:predicted lipoprotein with Yx(FWY)xxD motif